MLQTRMTWMIMYVWMMTAAMAAWFERSHWDPFDSRCAVEEWQLHRLRTAIHCHQFTKWGHSSKFRKYVIECIFWIYRPLQRNLPLSSFSFALPSSSLTDSPVLISIEFLSDFWNPWKSKHTKQHCKHCGDCIISDDCQWLLHHQSFKLHTSII